MSRLLLFLERQPNNTGVSAAQLPTAALLPGLPERAPVWRGFAFTLSLEEPGWKAHQMVPGCSVLVCVQRE